MRPWKSQTGPIVLPDVVTDAAFWYSVSWKHLLPICNEYAEFAAHEPNGENLMGNREPRHKNNDLRSEAQVGRLHLKIPHHWHIWYFIKLKP